MMRLWPVLLYAALQPSSFHHRGPRMKARELGVPVLKPLESWHLPPEKSEKDKRLERLERQANERFPRIQLGFRFDGPVKQSLEIVVPKLPPLEADDIEEKSEHIFNEHPRGTPRWGGRLELTLGSAPSRREIEVYHEKYDEYRTAVYQYLADFHHIVTRAAEKILHIPYFLENHGVIAAQGLNLQMEVGAGISWRSGRCDGVWRNRRQFPQAPQAPRPRDPLRAMLPSLLHQNLQKQSLRNPTNFYWTERPKPGATRATLQCADFHAKRRWEDNLLLLVSDDDKRELWLAMHLSASNLPAPVDEEISIRFVEKQMSWSAPEIAQLVEWILVGDGEETYSLSASGP